MALRRAFPTRLLCFGVAMVLVAGCSSPTTSLPSRAPSTTPSAAISTADADHAAAYARVQSELTDFLAVWKSKGYAEASKAYLVPGEQASPSDVVLVLASGRVAAVTPDQWTSPDLFVVYVDLDLTFSGDAGAWGTGVNSRFVTATARTGTIPYVLEFATGP